MEDKDQRRAAAGKGFQTGSSVSTEQTVLGWAVVAMGVLFMAAGGVVMFLSLS